MVRRTGWPAAAWVPVVTGMGSPGDINADNVPVHRFRLTDPDGPTPEQHQAVRDALIARMKPPRIFRMEG